jgi:hypothetical protein
MEELHEARLIEECGLEGCAHARPASKPQVLLVYGCGLGLRTKVGASAGRSLSLSWPC